MGNVKTKRPIKKPMAPWAYAVICLVSLLVGVVLLLLFKPKSAERLTGYIIVILMGFSAAAFLFGVLRSFAWYKRTKQNVNKKQRTALELGGPIVLFFLIVGLGLNWLSEDSPFDFTVFLRDAKGKTVVKSQGTIHVILDSDARTGKIDEKGSVYFKRIPAKFKNKPVPIELDAPGWQFTDARTSTDCILKEDSATLTIERDDSLCSFTGRVMDKDGNPIEGAALIIKDIEVKTGKNGWFKIEIPPEKQAKEQVLITKKEGYKTEMQTVFLPDPQEI